MTVGQDSQEELRDLTTVHTFYLGLLEKAWGQGVPVPAELTKTAEALKEVKNPAETVQTLRNWLDLLDLATTPPLVRDSLKTLPGFNTAHSLLRYFATKASVRSGD